MSKLEKTTCVLGQETLLTNKLEGIPRPILKVIKDGHGVNLDSNVISDYDGEKVTLHIKNASLENAGVYKIEATNEVGTDVMEGHIDIIGK